MDHKQFLDGASAPRKHYDSERSRWWKLSPIEAADAISQELNLLEKMQTKRIEQYMSSARLYGNLSVTGMAGVTWSRLAAIQPGLRDKISYNVVQSCVDTAQSKM